MKWLLVVLIGCFLVTGCATSSIDSRRKERQAAYAQFSPETRQLVDQGRIKVGMTMDAVYVAWGKPAQVLQNETPAGASTVWLYEGAWLETNPVWVSRWIGPRHRGHIEPYVAYDYQARSYVSAEIIFVGGVVKEWRTLPQPVN